MIDKLSSPQTAKSNGDIALSTIKGITGAIPLVGSAVNELIDFVVLAPAQKRQMEWQDALTEIINLLIKNVECVSAVSLSKNDEFLTAILATSNMAMKTSQREKIRMLQAVVYRSGSGLRLENFILNTFFQIVERYVPEHIILLRELTNQDSLKGAFDRLKINMPDKINSANMGPEKGEYCAVEDLANCLVKGMDETTASELFADLHRDGLCKGSEGFMLTYYINLPLSIVTERGTAFLKFVTLEQEDLS
jgi:hypothetical protein